jgi:holo-[acyl-carrier protein] synthase
VDRLRRLLSESPGVAREVFTERELAYCEGRRGAADHLAARFAAKEAVLKAFGTGLAERMKWSEVEVVNGLSGRPEIRLRGSVARWAAEARITDVEISMSHTAGLAIAQAVTVQGAG